MTENDAAKLVKVRWHSFGRVGCMVFTTKEYAKAWVGRVHLSNYWMESKERGVWKAVS